MRELAEPKWPDQQETPTRIKACKGKSVQDVTQPLQIKAIKQTRTYPTIHAALPPHPDQVCKPQCLHSDNGYGSLFCAGKAGPREYDTNDIIQGRQPSQTQTNSATIQGVPAKKQADHAAVRANRLQTWQQRLNFIPTKKSDKTTMDSPYTHPEDPILSTKKPPAVELGWTNSHPAADVRHFGV
jgi:hypothetical protein